MDYAKINEAAMGYKDDMTRFLRDLVRIPGESCGEKGHIMRIKEEMEKVGFDKVQIDPMGNILGYMGTGKTLIGFDAHIDTVGIGDNPLLAKLAMDNEAKHNKSMVAFWHYIDVPDTIWRIPKLEDVWGALILALLIIYVELALIMSTNWRTLIQQFSRKNLVLLVSSYLRKAGALIVVLSVISITQKLKAMATHRFYKETILSNEKSKLSFEKSANKLELEFEHIICVQARSVFILASPFQN